jgi:hypothetical protein
MKTTTNQETKRAAVLADERLAPIRLWAHNERGAMKKLTEKLQALSGEPITRQTICRWMHRDQEKRQQPSYGWGLHLEAAYQDLSA